LNVLNGAILAECKPRHRHQEFLDFLRSIDKAVPAGLDVHCIVDNYSSHKHPKVKAWLAARPRWNMHFIPTYSSWAEPGRALLLDHHWQGHPPRLVRLGQRTGHKDRSLRRSLQPDLQTLYLDRDR